MTPAFNDQNAGAISETGRAALNEARAIFDRSYGKPAPALAVEVNLYLRALHDDLGDDGFGPTCEMAADAGLWFGLAGR